MLEIGWVFTNDGTAFIDAALDFLGEDPIGNTVILGIAVQLTDSPREARPEDCYGWWRDAQGTVQAAFIAQAPGAVTLSARVPRQAAAELPTAWIGSGRARPVGVFGQVETAERIIADWAARTGDAYRAKPHFSLRLFSLDEPTPPDPAPRGESRLATPDDVGLSASWDLAFRTECGADQPANAEAFARRRIEAGLDMLWTVDGEPVAVARYGPIVVDTTRIWGVYTPPRHRRHGYAAGVTWAVTQEAQAHGAKHVLLFTDLSNPTSNSVYQRLGYRAICDVTEFEFTDRH